MLSTVSSPFQIHQTRLAPRIYQRQRSRGEFSITSSADPIDMHAQGAWHIQMLNSLRICYSSAVYSRASFCCRRDELAIGLTTAEGAKALLEKYTKEAVEAAMQAYVLEGRQAMGPSYLKVSQQISHSVRIVPAFFTYRTDRHACVRTGSSWQT